MCGGWCERLGISWSDPRWVGAWWLPYVVTAALCMLIALPLIGYPHDLPGTTIDHYKHRYRRRYVQFLLPAKAIGGVCTTACVCVSKL